jgi:hypothetical protein
MLLALVLPGVAWAQGQAPPSAPPAAPTAPAPSIEPSAEEARVAEARDLFKQGVESVKEAQWASALSAFERSAALRPHATTTFNIGACERAMGAYTRARASFRRSIEEDSARPGELAPSLLVEAQGLLREIEQLLAWVQITLEPEDAAVAVDGRPIVAEADGTFVAGVAPPGPGVSPKVRVFTVRMNPGAHVLTLSRKGFTDAVVNRSVSPGESASMDLRLDRLPATLDVSANVAGAIVTVDGKDLGPAPVSVLRPPGRYQVTVAKDGFDPYETRVEVQAGERSALSAVLTEESTPITKKWWFWTGAAGVVAAGVLTTFLLTRPEPEPPPYDGGSTGWVVRP